MKCKSLQFSKTTVIGSAINQVITGVGFVPKAVIMSCGNVAANNAYADDMVFSIGFSTGPTNSRWIAQINDHDTTTSTARNNDTDTVIQVIDGNGTTVLASAKVVSFDSDGITLVWNNTTTSATKINAFFIGGISVKAKADKITYGTTSVTGLGFQPKFIMSLVARGTASSSVTGNAAIGVGHAIGIDPDGQQKSQGWVWNVVSTIWTAQHTFQKNLFPGIAGNGSAILSGLVPGGFNLTWTGTNTTSVQYFYLAVDSGPNSVISLTTNTDPDITNLPTQEYPIGSALGILAFGSHIMGFASGQSSPVGSPFFVVTGQGAVHGNDVAAPNIAGVANSKAKAFQVISNTSLVKAGWKTTATATPSETRNLILQSITLDDFLLQQTVALNPNYQVDFVVFQGEDPIPSWSQVMLRYDDRNGVGRTRKMFYMAQNKVAQTMHADYKIQFAGGAVRTRQLVYHVKQSVWKIVGLVYNTGGKIGVTRNIPYNLRTILSRDRQIRYNMTGFTNRTLRYPYGIIRSPVFRERKLMYNTGGLVNQTRNLKWNMRQRAFAQLNAQFAKWQPVGPKSVNLKWTMIGHIEVDRQIKYKVVSQVYRTISIKYPVRILVPTIDVQITYEVRPPRENVSTTDDAYWRPLRPKISIKSNDNLQTYYVYDALLTFYNNIHVIGCEVIMTENSASVFSISIEDSKNEVDMEKIKLGNRVTIAVGKFTEDYERIVSGFIRRVRTERPETGNKVLIVEGFSTQIRTNERVTNFARVAARQGFVSNLPRVDDEQMIASRLVKELFEENDHLPVGEPLEPFTTTGVGNVTDFVPSISESYSAFSGVLDKIADMVGGRWHIDSNDNVVFRYPLATHSGVTIKDVQEPIDISMNTAYAVGPWRHEDSMLIEDGFANRIYVRHGSLDQAEVEQTQQNNYTGLNDRAIAQQFIPGSPKFQNLSLLMQKVGDPGGGPIEGQIVLDNGNNQPIGVPIASFTIRVEDFHTFQPEAMFRINLTFFTRKIQVDKPHWLIIYRIGSDENNTIRWYHDGDFTTNFRYSAVRSPGGKNTFEGWTVSPTGPLYTLVTFDSKIHVTESSDPFSIARHGLVETVLDLEWLLEDSAADRYASAILQYTAKPKRIYDLNKITAPDKVLFPGQLVNLIDAQAGFKRDPSTLAELVEVRYNFDTEDNALGTNYVEIKPVGYLEPFEQAPQVIFEEESAGTPFEELFGPEYGFKGPTLAPGLPPEIVEILEDSVKAARTRTIIDTPVIPVAETLGRRALKVRTIQETVTRAENLSGFRNAKLFVRNLTEITLVSSGINPNANFIDNNYVATNYVTTGAVTENVNVVKNP